MPWPRLGSRVPPHGRRPYVRFTGPDGELRLCSMKRPYAPARRPRRFARTRVAVLVGVLMTATIVALAMVHVPQPGSLTATSVSTDLSATATQPMVTGDVWHTALAGNTAPASDPSDGTCATCGAEQDGTVFAACALALFAIAAMRLTARPPQLTFALTGRRWVVRDRLAALSVPRTPNLHALCISRT